MTRRQREQKNMYSRAHSNQSIVNLTSKTIRDMVRILYHAIADVSDKRASNRTYRYNEVLAMIFIGLLCGKNTLCDIEEYLRLHPGKIKKWLGKKSPLQIPTDTTMSTVLANVDSLELMAIINEWSRQLFLCPGSPRHICVDGKAIRASLAKVLGGTHPPYILNAFDAESGAIDIQIEVGKKTNELGTMPELFSILDLKNATITMDAAGTNPQVARFLLRRDAHYVLPLKANQKNTVLLAHDFIMDQILGLEHPEDYLYADTDNGEYQHGRLSYRYYFYFTEGVEEIFKSTDFEGLLKGVGLVVRTNEQIRYDVETGNRIPQESTIETVVYGSDREDMTPEQFARFVRGHWGGCEAIHYVLDIEFDEDLSRLNRGNNRQNMSLLRKATISIIRYVKKLTVTTVSTHRIRMWFDAMDGIPLDMVKKTSDPP